MVRHIFLLLPLLSLTACSPGRTLPPEAPAPVVSSSEPAPAPPALTLVESAPIETTLDHPEIPDAKDVWVEMIKSATRSLDIAEFYISPREGSALSPVLDAIEEAARRGVVVRILVDLGFSNTYPEAVDRLNAQPGIEARRYDTQALMGGVLHAKYFIVDGKEAYLGSQNFDWRSLTHIQELGVRIREEHLTAALAALFEADWELAGGASREVLEKTTDVTFPQKLGEGEDALLVTPVFSPKEWLTDESLWDLPRLVEMIDGAKERVRVQLMSYGAKNRDKSPFLELDNALRRAAARGVRVELLLADWNKRPSKIKDIQDLAQVPNLAVKMMTIPPASEGFIPFARVIHAKYMVVDGALSWVGTSNWEGDYFYKSRNVGLLVEGKSFARQLDSFFSDGWESEYAYPVDPNATYEPPRISE